MFKVINRKECQLLDDIDMEFSDCVVVVQMKENCADRGYLLAYSNSLDSSEELNAYLDSLPKDMVLYVGGVYEEGDALYVPD